MQPTLIGDRFPYSAAIELFTGDCNLRCRYCPIQTDKTKFPDYPRRKMATEAVDHIKRLLGDDRPNTIDLCGNGETTMLKDWIEICKPFFFCTDNIGIMSNLGKVLSRDEISFLARFNFIVTSIDTADAKLLKEIRHPVQLRNITLNLNLIRTAAVIKGCSPPSTSINCTVTTKNYRELTQLVALASTLNVGLVQFSNLLETPTSVSHGIRSITTLESADLKEAVKEIHRACDLGKKNGVRVDATNVVRRVNLVATENHNILRDDTFQKESSAILCMLPWNGFWVNSDGHVSFCCRHMGTTDRDITQFNSVRELLNDKNAVHLREKLLYGPCPERCRTCDLGQPCTSEQFMKVLQMHRFFFRRLAAIVRRLPLKHGIWKILKQIYSRVTV